MASNAELVAIWITEVCPIIVGMILRPKPWLSFARATIFQRNGIYLVHDFAGIGQECHHLAVACCMRLFVVRASDDE